VEETIHNLDTVVDSLQQESYVDSFTQRVYSYAMITSAANLQSISMVGINPETERALSQIDDVMQQGDYLEGSNPRDVVIGAELAEILEVEIDDRVVITVAQAETGDLSQEMFRISGIYRFGINEMDQSMAFVRIEKAQEMLNISGVHEIAINFTSDDIGQNRDHPFWDEYSQFGNKAQGWVELNPQLASYMQISDFMTYFIGLILFGVVALGIVNTLFMSLHERMFEFGVLRAVGTRPFAMGRLVVFEAAALSILSIIVGVVLGFLVTYLTSFIGIDYTGIEVVGVTIREKIYPVLEITQFIEYPFWVLVFTTITGIYPGWYAARMEPADAMRKSF
jgi:ABC-type lipoprotein release transport system permease subunit